MKVLNFTVDIDSKWTQDPEPSSRNMFKDFVVLCCEGEEIWRNNGDEYLGRGHGGNEYDYAIQIVAKKFRELFNNLRV